MSKTRKTVKARPGTDFSRLVPGGVVSPRDKLDGLARSIDIREPELGLGDANAKVIHPVTKAGWRRTMLGIHGAVTGKRPKGLPGKGNDLVATLAELGKGWRACDRARKRALEKDPNNGRKGWWAVRGLRHSAIVRASSAPEAVGKAEKAGAVGDWESGDAQFLGEGLPDVVRI